MIVSHSHKFIFIKTNKTAGTSIEIALSKFCGDKDIITPISPKDEKIRTQLGHRGPQNYLVPFHDYAFRDWIRFLLRGKRRKFYNHISAKEIKRLVGEEIWNHYYKFCFERNPWDRVISLYYWRYNAQQRETISEFIDSGALRALKRKGIEAYSIDGEISVDRVCLYENLEEELESVCNRQLDITERVNLPKVKSSFRKDRRHYREILSNDDKEKIAKMFSKEIAAFGYEY